jgi:hypothetical protein
MTSMRLSTICRPLGGVGSAGTPPAVSYTCVLRPVLSRSETSSLLVVPGFSRSSLVVRWPKLVVLSCLPSFSSRLLVVRPTVV